MKHWVHTNAFFSYSNEIDELIGGSKEDVGEFHFDAREVIAYNRSSNGVNTTIRMSSGFDITVDIPFESFEQALTSALNADQ